MIGNYKTGQFIPEEHIKSIYLNYGPSSFTITPSTPEHKILLDPVFDPDMDFQLTFSFEGEVTSKAHTFVRVSVDDSDFGMNEFSIASSEGNIVFHDAYDYELGLSPVITKFTFNIERYGNSATVSIRNDNTGQTYIDSWAPVSLGSVCRYLVVGDKYEIVPSTWTIKDLVFRNFNN